MPSNQYYCLPTFNSTTNQSFYAKYLNSVLNLKQYGKTLEIETECYIIGNYNLPPNILMLNFYTNIGEFKNVSMKLQSSDASAIHKYKANIWINTDNVSDIKGESIFNKTISFSANLSVNSDLFNSLKLSFNGNKWYKEILKIKFNGEFLFSNYLPINKLNEYYINQKYLNDYLYLEKLPMDFYKWADKTMNIYPEYWFIQTEDFTKLSPIQIMNKIYHANVKNSSFSKEFDNVVINVTYTVNNMKKNLALSFDKIVDNISQINSLFLNVKTLYNFTTNELYQSSDGVTGIYFPIATDGELEIVLTKNNIVYKDKIPFTYKDKFYDDNNATFKVTLDTFKELDGQWYEVIYA